MTEDILVQTGAGGPGTREQRGARLRWSLVPIGLLGAAAVVMLLHRRIEQKAEAAAPFAVDGNVVDIRAGAPTWTYLDFAKAGLEDPVAPAPVPGRVAFDESRAAPVVAPLSGRIDAVAVRLGERVKVGDRLIAVRSADLIDLSKQIDVMRSKEAARAKAVDRLRSLVALKAEPEKKLLDAEQELRQAELAREAAEQKLKSLSVAGAADGKYWITASREGVVVERHVLNGQEVGPDRSEPLLVVADLDEVIVTADVPEADVADLSVGQPAEVSSSVASDRMPAGRVEYIGEVIDPERRMVDVRVRVPNQDHQLRPNAFVQVSFTPSEQKHVVVPAEAVVTDDQESFVFVRGSGSPDSLERREVVPGRQRRGRIEIASGLAPGETYVTKGAILLLNAIDLAQQ
jgi:membrane fusion protein, heavy metal efflux system